MPAWGKNINAYIDQVILPRSRYMSKQTSKITRHTVKIILSWGSIELIMTVSDTRGIRCWIVLGTLESSYAFSKPGKSKAQYSLPYDVIYSAVAGCEKIR